MNDPVKTKVSMDNYIKSLHKEGYKTIGTGCYAEVLSKPRGRTVIKVSECVSDDGWLSYVSLVLKNPEQPCFPCIKSHKVYNHKYGMYSVTHMERLQPLYDFPDKQIKKILGIAPYQIDNCFSVFKKNKTPKKVWSALKLLKKQYRKSTVNLDFHDGNIMVRVNGKKKTVVFTDPFS